VQLPEFFLTFSKEARERRKALYQKKRIRQLLTFPGFRLGQEGLLVSEIFAVLGLCSFVAIH